MCLSEWTGSLSEWISSGFRFLSEWISSGFRFLSEWISSGFRFLSERSETKDQKPGMRATTRSMSLMPTNGAMTPPTP